jgi:Ca-activated chloride channel family protein
VLAARIRHPVLTDLAIADAPVRLREIYPVTLPDLFAGEELILFGRYEGAGSGRIAIAGRRDGRAERYATAARFADHDSDNDFIPRLWASRKLGSLAQQVRLNGPDPELVEEIRSTALRYGLLSEYTSYLVQEPELVVASRDSMAQRLQRMAAAPVAGEAAVRRSEDARAAGAVRSLGDLVSAQKAAYESAAANAADVYGARATRTIGGRVFRQTGGEWIDALHRAGARVVEIEAFSPAYFALLRRLPELAEYWKELPAALVAGREAGIRVGPRGLRQLSDAELGRIAAGFRF